MSLGSGRPQDGKAPENTEQKKARGIYSFPLSPRAPFPLNLCTCPPRQPLAVCPPVLAHHIHPVPSVSLWSLAAARASRGAPDDGVHPLPRRFPGSHLQRGPSIQGRACGHAGRRLLPHRLRPIQLWWVYLLSISQRPHPAARSHLLRQQMAQALEQWPGQTGPLPQGARSP